MGIFRHHLYDFMLKDFDFFVNEVWRKVQVFCVQNGIPVGFAQEKIQCGGFFWKPAGFRRKKRRICRRISRPLEQTAGQRKKRF